MPASCRGFSNRTWTLKSFLAGRRSSCCRYVFRYIRLLSRNDDRQREKKEGFSFRQYFHRRIIRLFPSLIFVLIFTTIVAFCLFSPKLLLSYAESLFFSAIQMSNYYFYANVDYFDIESYQRPLLHTWSLSIEEQFFVIAPFIMLFLRRKLGTWKIVFVLFLVSITNLVLIYMLKNYTPDKSVWIPTSGQIAANVNNSLFYLPQFRLFEFCIGMGGYLIQRFIPDKQSPQLFLFAWFLIIGSWILIDKTQFPSPYISHLLPCISVLLLIYSGNQKIYAKNAINKWLIPIGEASYSIYLVHWPIVVFGFYLGLNSERFLDTLFLFFLIIVSGRLVYTMIEKPLRVLGYSEDRAGRNLVVTCIFLLLVLILVSIKLIQDRGIHFGHPPAISDKDLKNYNELSLPQKAYTNIAIIGDSHATHLIPMFRSHFSEMNIAVEGYTGSGCVPIPGISAFRYYKGPISFVEPDIISPHCKKYHRNLLTKALEQFDVFIISAGWSYYFGDDFDSKSVLIKYCENQVCTEHEEQIKLAFEKFIDFLSINGKLIVLFSQVALTGIDTFDCIQRPFSASSHCESALTASQAASKSKGLDNFFSTLAKKYENVLWIDPKNKMCDQIKDRCIIQIDEVPIYRDNNHLSAVGSQKLGTLLYEDFIKIEKLVLTNDNFGQLEGVQSSVSDD
ncbi:acyltransferase family protein [Planctobacterium marinum]|uniref:acyltransferase family protein n=1 Tax=Planctobacterium marinum TaxID=1631968 RepID=UPI002B4BDC84|nr:acyltransferase family protein [Planctobacterium marinum]